MAGAAGFAAVGLVVLLAACGPASSSVGGASAGASNGGTTVTYAMSPGGTAAYPFPFMGLNQIGFDSIFNIDDFQYLVYRPLYWFGIGTKPYVNPELSLAYKPTYQGNVVTIKLKKTYKWSNGEPVDAQDVVFWMNMMKAEGENDAYFSPTGLPSDVTNIRTAGKYVMKMDITTPKFSESWFDNNELSQVTPMPMAWDRTAAGPSHCATVVADCKAVFNYLTAQSSKAPSTFPTSPLWSVVDGPWKIQRLTTDGNLTLTYNNSYGGPKVPDHITTFIELPFTSEAAEFNVLQDPTSSQTIDVGYLPTVDALVPPAGSNVGANPRTLSDYQLSALYPWQLTYFPYNYKNTTGQAPIFDQTYFREAFQSLVDEEGVIDGPLHGYGKPVFGPVSGFPATKYISPQVAALGDRWTLSVKRAETLLADNGWSVKPNGTDTCVRAGTGPGHCGAKIPAGTQLKLKLMYATGIDWMQSAARELASNASLAGINLSLIPESFDDVVNAAFGVSPTCTASNCTWQMAWWGTWTYSPDFLPTGDELFEGGAPNNAGDYNNQHNNQLITATLQARTAAQFDSAMYRWQNYLAPQLPVVYEPDYPSLVETIRGLDIGPQNSALTIMPEEWHYLK
ncbi:MAG TPA: ABC transporter substrate-binding protein [Streptosporangiaceae bacterium]|nr:ABC transporter substrate-binding protein [Streptosporangiaceae bacterium]